MTTEPDHSPTIEIVDGMVHIDDRPVPWAEPVSKSLFFPDAVTVWEHRQALFHCENGWVVTAIWSSGSYTVNRYHPGSGDVFIERVVLVECGVLHLPEPGALLQWPDGDTVCGNVPVASLLELVGLVSAWSSDPTPPADTGFRVHDVGPETGWSGVMRFVDGGGETPGGVTPRP